MLRLAAALLVAGSAVVAAPVPAPGKTAKDRAAVLAELGLPDTGQKLPAVPADYRPGADQDNNEWIAFRANFVSLRTHLNAQRLAPFHDTLAGGGNLDLVKALIRKTQVDVARRTVDLTEALETLQTNAEKIAGMPKRWQAVSRLLIATARQELAAMDEYNLALGNVITETVAVPADTADALKLVAVPRMRSGRAVRESAALAAKELAAVAKDHPNTPWAALATEAADRHLGLVWVPKK